MRYFTLPALAIALSFAACNQNQNNTQPQPNPDEVIDFDSTDFQTRALRVSKLNALDVFHRLPIDLLRSVEGLEKLDGRARQKMVQDGKWGAFKLTMPVSNWLTLSEQAQNDDDANETMSALHIVVFDQEAGPKSVLVIKELRSESDGEWVQPQGVSLWEFDGRGWEDQTYLLPRTRTEDFFREGFALKGNAASYFRYMPDPADPNSVSIGLLYPLYAQNNKQIKEQYLMDNEYFLINWKWNGERLELQKRVVSTVR